MRTSYRALLVFAAVMLAGGGVAHTRALASAVAVIDVTQLPPFFAKSFKALWVNDSVSLFGFALLLAYIAARPATVPRSIVLLLALPLFGYALSLYATLGGFFAAHLLFAAGLMCVLAALMGPRARCERQGAH